MKKQMISLVVFSMILDKVIAQSGVSFYPVWEYEEFSKREIPAKLITESETPLRENGYVIIGTINYKITHKTCWYNEKQPCDYSFCDYKVIPNSFSDEIARKAAFFGGDLMTWDNGKVFTVDERKQGKCLTRIRREVNVYNALTDKWQMQYVFDCTSWEDIHGKSCVQISTGKIWRKKDLRLEHLIKRDENIDNILKKKAGDNLSDLKRKDESEFKKYITQFADNDKYYAIDKWYRHNEELWQKNSKLINENSSGKELKSFSTYDDKIRERFGYKDNSGKIIIEPQFLSADDFSEGLGCVSIPKGLKKVYGYIDKSAHWVIAPIFDEAHIFISGIASVTIDGEHGYIDKTGKLFMVNEIREPAKIEEDLKKTEEKQKLYDLSLGNESDFFNALANIDEEKKFNAVKKRYEEITDSFDLFLKYQDTTAEVITAKKYNNGKYVIEPPEIKCEECKSVCGYKDKKGNIIIEPQFASCGFFCDSLACVAIREGKKLKFGYINKSGIWVVPPVYDYGYPFYGGVAKVDIKGKDGYIDKNGKLYKK